MMWTDPPYNVDYSAKAGKIKNDKMSDAEFHRFLAKFYGLAIAFLKPGAPAYIAHADGQPSFAFRNEFLAAGFRFSTCLIWKKHQATIGRGDFHYQHEPILYGWKPGKGHSWYGGRKRKSVLQFGEQPLFVKMDDGSFQVRMTDNLLVISGKDIEIESLQPTVIEIDKPSRSVLHPTMKPVALVEQCLVNSSRPGDVVFDGFSGSGTTIIACEIRDRCARVMELDPVYADVSVRRWQDFSGKQAELVGGGLYDQVMEKRAAHAKAD